ncbi:hypothetical protein TKK_0010751 [Trichogramma kaykai]
MTIMMLWAVIVCLVALPIATTDTSATEMTTSNDNGSKTTTTAIKPMAHQTSSSSSSSSWDKEAYLKRSFDWFSDKLLGILETFVPDGRQARSTSLDGRKHNKKKKKLKLNKYVFPLIVGFLLIKSVLLPLALKALAILSGKAVVLSLMSLILAAIIGLRSIVGGGGGNVPFQSKVDLVNLPLTKYKRKDLLDYGDPTVEEETPYRYYSDRHRRRRK